MTFETFWSEKYAHPQNRGVKEIARIRFERIAAKDGVISLGEALNAYLAYQEREKRWYKPMQAQRFLNKDWKAWIPEPEKPKSLMEHVAETEEKEAFLRAKAQAAVNWRKRVNLPEVSVEEMMVRMREDL